MLNEANFKKERHYACRPDGTQSYAHTHQWNTEREREKTDSSHSHLTAVAGRFALIRFACRTLGSTAALELVPITSV